MSARLVPCRRCRAPKPVRLYLCGNCWSGLSAPGRRLLNRRDGQALARLRELQEQVDAGVPLADIRVSLPAAVAQPGKET